MCTWTTTSQTTCSAPGMRGDARILALVIREDLFCARTTGIAGLCSVSQASGKAVGREGNLESTRSCQIMSNGYTLGQIKCGKVAICNL
jgi:hypothetical protein